MSTSHNSALGIWTMVCKNPKAEILTLTQPQIITSRLSFGGRPQVISNFLNSKSIFHSLSVSRSLSCSLCVCFLEDTRVSMRTIGVHGLDMLGKPPLSYIPSLLASFSMTHQFKCFKAPISLDGEKEMMSGAWGVGQKQSTDLVRARP